MAATVGFKQPCPSCDEKVLIKDEKLVGKKVDCPKCKYRFVVEKPSANGDADEEVEEKPAKKKASATMKSAAAKPGKGTATKGKPAKKPADDDEDEDDDDKPKAKNSKKKKLVIVCSLAGAAVVLLGVVAFFIFGGSDGGSSSSGRRSGLGINANSVGAVAPAPPAADAKPAEAARTAAELADASHHLLGNVDLVINVNVSEFFRSPLGNLALDAGLRADWFRERFGVALNDVDRLMFGKCPDNTGMLILRTSAAMSLDTLKKSFDVQNGETVKGQEYQLINLAELVKFLNSLNDDKATEPNAKAEESLAMRLHDPFTLVLADVPLMKLFLEAEGKPPLKQAPSSGGTSGPGTAPPMGPPTGPPTGPPPGPPAGPPPGPPVGGKSGGQAPPPAGAIPPAGGPGAPPAGAIPPAGVPGAPAGGSSAPVSTAYGTIENASLRGFLQQHEAKKDKPIASMAFITKSNVNAKSDLAKALSSNATVQAAGAALVMDGSLNGVFTLYCSSVDQAKKVEPALKAALMQVTAQAQQTSALKFVWLADQENTNPAIPGGPALPPPPPVGVNPAPPGVNPNPGANPNAGGAPVGDKPAAGANDNAPTFTIEGPRQLEAAVHMSVKTNPAAVVALKAGLMGDISRLKGEWAMQSLNPSPHEVLAAVKAAADKTRTYPRGTFDRPVPGARQGRPWAPDQRVSWLAGLLPYLGHDDLLRQIDLKKSWRDPENLPSAMTLVPYFINPTFPKSSRYLNQRDLRELAATHYVGIAGVGLDAAEYGEKDEDFTTQRGVFGYERMTPLSDVGDHTIVMIQVPSTHVGPWLAGGGATVRGVPAKNSVKPFVSTSFDGKKGTYALMSDGSVRFLAEDISDEVFKALATVKKAKPVAGMDGLPMVPPPAKKSELKAGAPAEKK